MAATANAAQPWHAHYPPPKNLHPSSITPLELLDLIRAGQKAGKDFLLVDLRRNDHEVSWSQCLGPYSYGLSFLRG